MPRNALRRMVHDMDRERASASRIEPDRLILPPRPGPADRTICIACRRVPEETLYAAWHEKYVAASPEERRQLPSWWAGLKDIGKTCPTCGGRLVSVTT